MTSPKVQALIEALKKIATGHTNHPGEAELRAEIRALVAVAVDALQALEAETPAVGEEGFPFDELKDEWHRQHRQRGFGLYLRGARWAWERKSTQPRDGITAETRHFKFYGTTDCKSCETGRVTLFIADERCMSCDPESYKPRAKGITVSKEEWEKLFEIMSWYAQWLNVGNTTTPSEIRPKIWVIKEGGVYWEIERGNNAKLGVTLMREIEARK